MSLVELERNAAVAEIRFNRPEVLNALDLATAEAFSEAVDQALADTGVRAVVLSGEGRAFMAGGDLAYFRDRTPAERPEASRDLIGTMNAALLKLRRGSKPTVACVQGAAAGAGMSLALMADLAVAAEDARFTLSYVKVAASPDCGGSYALVQLVGLRRAMEIALLSDTLDAAAALRLGLVNKVVPAVNLREQTFALADRLARVAPLALAATKRLLLRSADGALAAQLDAEVESFAELSGSSDFNEALQAFFDKRSPLFEAR